MKLVCETSKNTKLCFSSNSCRTDIKDIEEKIKEVNRHLENHCKWQVWASLTRSTLANLTLLQKDCLLKAVEVISWQKVF